MPNQVQPAQIRVEERPRGRLTRLISWWIPALVAVQAAAAPPPERPDFLVVTFDTTRVDRFATHGADRLLTPNANALAQLGTAFLNCVAPAGTTAPSHASLFTGIHPARHGVLSNAHRLSDEFDTLAEQLSQEGYATAAFVGMRALETAGLRQGFAQWSRFDGWVRTARQTNVDVRRWLKNRARHPDTPFFLWVHYFDPHSPYHASDWSRQRLPEYEGRYSDDVTTNLFGIGEWLQSPEDRRAVRTLYDGQVHATDAAFGQLMRRLRASRRAPRTVVVLAADHGQALGDGGHPGHGILIHSVLHVPLVIADGRNPQPRTVSERVGLVDIAPTLLELAGLPPNPGHEGRSLVPALRGERLETATYAATRQPLPEGGFWGARTIGLAGYDAAVYSGHIKVLVGSGDPIAFDLKADPTELSPLPDAAARYPGLVEAAEANRVSGGATPPDVSEETREQLRALGYGE